MTMLQQTIKELQESEMAGPSNNAEQLGTLQDENAALQQQNDELKARVAQVLRADSPLGAVGCWGFHMRYAIYNTALRGC